MCGPISLYTHPREHPSELAGLEHRWSSRGDREHRDLRWQSGSAHQASTIPRNITIYKIELHPTSSLCSSALKNYCVWFLCQWCGLCSCCCRRVDDEQCVVLGLCRDEDVAWWEMEVDSSTTMMPWLWKRKCRRRRDIHHIFEWFSAQLARRFFISDGSPVKAINCSRKVIWHSITRMEKRC